MTLYMVVKLHSKKGAFREASPSSKKNLQFFYYTIEICIKQEENPHFFYHAPLHILIQGELKWKYKSVWTHNFVTSHSAVKNDDQMPCPCAYLSTSWSDYVNTPRAVGLLRECRPISDLWTRFSPRSSCIYLSIVILTDLKINLQSIPLGPL
jgi:hypothetical protein